MCKGVGGLKDASSVKTPEQIARCGHDGMLRGERVTVNDSRVEFPLSQVTPLLPRRRLLKMSRQFMV